MKDFNIKIKTIGTISQTASNFHFTFRNFIKLLNTVNPGEQHFGLASLCSPRPRHFNWPWEAFSKQDSYGLKTSTARHSLLVDTFKQVFKPTVNFTV